MEIFFTDKSGAFTSALVSIKYKTGIHMGLPLRNQMIHNVQHPVWSPEKVPHMAKQVTAR